MRRWIAPLVFCTLLAVPLPASANLILAGGTIEDSFTDLGAQGFGNAPRMLTLQDSPYESGYVTPVDVVHDDAIAGANKSTTPTLDELNWATGSNVGIGFNSNQTGISGITLQELVLTIYDGTTAVGSFALASPITFTKAQLDLQQGNGNAVFNFVLDAPQQAQFNTIAAMPGSSGFYAGLFAVLGCDGDGDPAGCKDSNDGADSFVGFRQPGTPGEGGGSVPEPSSLVLLGFGLTFAARRLRRQ